MLWTSTGATTGTLTITSGALNATVTLFGSYLANGSSFQMVSDGMHGTLVTDPPFGDSQNLLTPPHA